MKPSKNFYQWDINQKFTECDGRFVDFIINEKVVYRVDIVNGECIIPDEFLQKSGYHTVYECMSDYTIQNHMFPVHPREKPPGYVYTPTEKLTFEGLVQKVNDTVADIIHRADTGEFDGYTPVKGKDYFTEAEKNEMVQSVSSGAVGEFREVVDSATADFNKNSSVKTNDYNTNAETKTAEFDSNAAEKLKAYNDNHTEKMTAYDTNATDKLSTYNSNAEQKLESYNSNHTEKLTEYNTNAETKTAEFDSNAAALQTEVDRLRGECDTLQAENRKQENRISALMKLNKGQTYDILPEEGEAAIRTAPSGSKYVSVDKVGGKSIVWNQQVDTSKAVLATRAGVTLSRKENGKLFLSGTATGGTAWCIVGEASLVVGHKYLSSRVGENIPLRIERTSGGNITMIFNGGLEVQTLTTEAKSFVFTPVNEGETVNAEIAPFIIDLTLLFGAGNEPTAEQWAAMFPEESYPYTPGEIISSRTETITAGAEAITTGFPELRSALAAHDYIDMDGGKIHRKIKSVRIDGNTPIYGVSVDTDANCCRIVFENQLTPGIIGSKNEKVKSNIISDRLATISHAGYLDNSLRASGINVFESLQAVCFRLHDRTDIDTKEKAKEWITENPTTVYYEINPEEVTDVQIPEALQEWLPVEPGGTVTFKNADESKQLAVPNAVSWVRKLDEVE